MNKLEKNHKRTWSSEKDVLPKLFICSTLIFQKECISHIRLISMFILARCSLVIIDFTKCKILGIGCIPLRLSTTKVMVNLRMF